MSEIKGSQFEFDGREWTVTKVANDEQEGALNNTEELTSNPEINFWAPWWTGCNTPPEDVHLVEHGSNRLVLYFYHPSLISYQITASPAEKEPKKKPQGVIAVKKIAKEYAEHLQENGSLDREQELADEHRGQEIRVYRHSMGGGVTSYYYWHPRTEEVLDGPEFVGTGSGNYNYREIGLVEFVVCREQGETWIQPRRTILPADENMSYSDRQPQFPDLSRIDEEELLRTRDSRPHSLPLVECIECNSHHLPLEAKLEPGGGLLALEVQRGPGPHPPFPVLCRECGENMTVGEFLKDHPEHRDLLTDEYAMSEDAPLFE